MKNSIKYLFFFALLANNLLADAPNVLQKAFEEGIAHTDLYQTPRGNQLRYAHFKSPVEGPKDTLFFIQGRSTFLEFYACIVLPLLERGFDVWMYDLSGQGESTRLLSHEKHGAETVQQMQHVDSFDLYVEDAYSFINEVLLTQVNGRLYLGGYSTGGHIALRFLQCHPEVSFERAFVISPLLALKAPIPHIMISCLLWSASFLVNLECYIQGAGHEDPIFTMPFEQNPYTSDESGFREIQDLCVQNKSKMMGGISFGWLKAASNSVESLWKDEGLRAIQIPVLIATGGADGVVDVSYNKYFANKLARSVHVYYPKGRHELFRETPKVRAAWWNELDAFLAERNKHKQAQ